MSQVLPETNGATPAADAAGTGDGGTQTPEGFVPKADFERTEAQRREFQRQLDSTKAELAAAKAAAAPAPTVTPTEGASDFDPAAFRRQLISEVAIVSQIQAAAVQLRADFPNADPAIFSPDRLAGFQSVDALRLAAEADHLRVQALVDAGVAAKEAAIRADNEQRHGGGSGTPGTPGIPGDPTPAALAAMTTYEWEELEAKNPGVIERVLRSAN